MKKLLSILPLLLLPTESNAELSFDPCMPEFKPPVEYSIITQWPTRIYYTDMDTVKKYCNVPLSWDSYGCFVTYQSGATELYLHDTGDPVANVCVLQHEMAHVQGWRHN